MAQSLTYLLDTNVWLERLLDQERAEEVKQLLETVSSDRLLITDFSFHSIGVILLRLERSEVLLSFSKDLFADNSVGLLALGPGDMQRLITVASDYRLDFDDAYQYVGAERNGVSLVRKPGSAWSKANKERVERMNAAEKMRPAGLWKIEQSKADGSWAFLDDVEAFVIPDDLAAALAEYEDAEENFAAFPPSSRRGILEWIKQAKRPETRSKRVRETAELASRNVRANQYRR